MKNWLFLNQFSSYPLTYVVLSLSILKRREPFFIFSMPVLNLLPSVVSHSIFFPKLKKHKHFNLFSQEDIQVFNEFDCPLLTFPDILYFYSSVMTRTVQTTSNVNIVLFFNPPFFNDTLCRLFLFCSHTESTTLILSTMNLRSFSWLIQRPQNPLM